MSFSCTGSCVRTLVPPTDTAVLGGCETFWTMSQLAEIGSRGQALKVPGTLDSVLSSSFLTL